MIRVDRYTPSTSPSCSPDPPTSNRLALSTGTVSCLCLHVLLFAARPGRLELAFHAPRLLNAVDDMQPVRARDQTSSCIGRNRAADYHWKARDRK